MNKTVPYFEEDLKQSRRNCAKFERDNRPGPAIPYSYILKRWWQSKVHKYNTNQAFRDSIDFLSLIVLACVSFVGIFIVLFHVTNPKPEQAMKYMLIASAVAIGSVLIRGVILVIKSKRNKT